MTVTRLEEVVAITMGQAPPGESYNNKGDGLPLIAGAGDFTPTGIAVKKYTTSSSKVSNAGDIILGIRASIGDKRVADSEYALGRGVASLRPTATIDHRYLWHWLGNIEDELAGKGKGATFKQVNRQDIAEMLIDVLPLDVQRRIADVLDRTDELRAKRRRCIALLNDLTQSIFIDMFGDPVSNSREWSAATVGDFVERFESGKSLAPGHDDSGSKFRVLKVSAVTSRTFNPGESKPLPAGYDPAESHIVRQGDLLFCRANGNPDLIGTTAQVGQIEPKYALPDKLWRFVWKKDRSVDPRFVHSLFAQPMFHRQIKHSAAGNGVLNISQSKVLSQRVILPSIHRQESFSRQAAAIDLDRIRMSDQLRVLDTLFSSLQSRAFAGDLWKDDPKHQEVE
ncbi:restriction endonuclease subunit S [Nocardia thailandica]|uniref:Restriction endonuclease subunit S n=1 Tax=Nocardia thailandica TaxID=257275 RepID=A0ABW6PFS7_9NOCA